MLPAQRLCTLLLTLAASLFAAACSSSPSQLELEYWKPEVTGEGDEYNVTVQVQTEGQADLAEKVLEKRIAEQALGRAVDEILGDSGMAGDQNDVYQRVVSQSSRYIRSMTKVEGTTLQGGSVLAGRYIVQVDRNALLEVLAKRGFLENQTLRTILVLRDVEDTLGLSGSEGEQAVQDLSENLSRELYLRGFEPKLWQDVQMSVAEQLDSGDEQLEEAVMTYVLDSAWRQDSSERYALENFVLRLEGRMLVGMRVLELDKRDLGVHATVRTDLYDLWNRRSLGAFTTSANVDIGGRTLLEAKLDAIAQCSNEGIAEVCGALQEVVVAEGRGRRKDYEIRFVGYEAGERNRIAGLLAGVLSEDAESNVDGGELVVTTAIPRDPAPVQQELERMLKALQIQAQPASRNGTQIVFTR
ncbi:MAG: hypothetical protein ACI835_005722 [Planctomycetota bacterium]|jgi:hypothetical protein